MKKLLYLLIPIILAGCNIKKRQIEKQHYLNFKRPEILAEDFNRLFPSKPDSTGRIVYADNTADKRRIDSLTAALKGATDTYIIDSTFCDTADLYRAYLDVVKDNKKLLGIIADIKQAYNNRKPDTVKVYQSKCPEIPMLKNQLRAAEDKLLKAETLLTEKTKSANKWFWVSMGLGLLIVVGGVVWVYRKFTKII